MYKVEFTKRFIKDLDKLISKNPQLKNKVSKQIKILRRNPRHGSLRLHKLAGLDQWSISINRSTRLIFSIRGNKVFCLRIGTHDEVYD